MKSEKAKELIEKYAVGNSRDAAPRMMKHWVIECVELAEQEAEERMREKAVEAFKSTCAFMDRRCKPDCKGCWKVKQFIQKLNEE